MAKQNSSKDTSDEPLKRTKKTYGMLIAPKVEAVKSKDKKKKSEN